MENLIEEEFHVPVRWVETQAEDTEDSAFSSFKMLNRDGIANILLVTDASHMRRAELVYSKVGFKVIPAPTDITVTEGGSRSRLYPNYELATEGRAQQLFQAGVPASFNGIPAPVLMLLGCKFRPLQLGGCGGEQGIIH